MANKGAGHSGNEVTAAKGLPPATVVGKTTTTGMLTTDLELKMPATHLAQIKNIIDQVPKDLQPEVKELLKQRFLWGFYSIPARNYEIKELQIKLNSTISKYDQTFTQFKSKAEKLGHSSQIEKIEQELQSIHLEGILAWGKYHEQRKEEFEKASKAENKTFYGLIRQAGVSLGHFVESVDNLVLGNWKQGEALITAALKGENAFAAARDAGAAHLRNNMKFYGGLWGSIYGDDARLARMNLWQAGVANNALGHLTSAIFDPALGAARMGYDQSIMSLYGLSAAELEYKQKNDVSFRLALASFHVAEFCLGAALTGNTANLGRFAATSTAFGSASALSQELQSEEGPSLITFLEKTLENTASSGMFIGGVALLGNSYVRLRFGRSVPKITNQLLELAQKDPIKFAKLQKYLAQSQWLRTSIDVADSVNDLVESVSNTIGQILGLSGFEDLLKKKELRKLSGAILGVFISYVDAFDVEFALKTKSTAKTNDSSKEKDQEIAKFLEDLGKKLGIDLSDDADTRIPPKPKPTPTPGPRGPKDPRRPRPTSGNGVYFEVEPKNQQAKLPNTIKAEINQIAQLPIATNEIEKEKGTTENFRSADFSPLVVANSSGLKSALRSSIGVPPSTKLCAEILNFALTDKTFAVKDFEPLYQRAVTQAVNENSFSALQLIRSITQLASLENRIHKSYEQSPTTLPTLYEKLDLLDAQKNKILPARYLNTTRDGRVVNPDTISITDLYTLREVKTLIDKSQASIEDRVWAIALIAKISKQTISPQLTSFFGVDIVSYITTNAAVQSALRTQNKINPDILTRNLNDYNLSIRLKNQGETSIVSSQQLLEQKAIEHQLKLHQLNNPNMTAKELIAYEKNLRAIPFTGIGFYDSLNRHAYVLSSKALKTVFSNNHYSPRVLSLFQQVILRHERFHHLAQLQNFNNPQQSLIEEEILAWKKTVRDFAQFNIRVEFSESGFRLVESRGNIPEQIRRQTQQIIIADNTIIRTWVRNNYRKTELALMSTGDQSQNSDPIVINPIQAEESLDNFYSRVFQTLIELEKYESAIQFVQGAAISVMTADDLVSITLAAESKPYVTYVGALHCALFNLLSPLNDLLPHLDSSQLALPTFYAVLNSHNDIADLLIEEIEKQNPSLLSQVFYDLLAEGNDQCLAYANKLIAKFKASNLLELDPAAEVVSTINAVLDHESEGADRLIQEIENQNPGLIPRVFYALLRTGNKECLAYANILAAQYQESYLQKRIISILLQKALSMFFDNIPIEGIALENKAGLAQVKGIITYYDLNPETARLMHPIIFAVVNSHLDIADLLIKEIEKQNPNLISRTFYTLLKQGDEKCLKYAKKLADRYRKSYLKENFRRNALQAAIIMFFNNISRGSIPSEKIKNREILYKIKRIFNLDHQILSIQQIQIIQLDIYTGYLAEGDYPSADLILSFSPPETIQLKQAHADAVCLALRLGNIEVANQLYTDPHLEFPQGFDTHSGDYIFSCVVAYKQFLKDKKDSAAKEIYDDHRTEIDLVLAIEKKDLENSEKLIKEVSNPSFLNSASGKSLLQKVICDLALNGEGEKALRFFTIAKIRGFKVSDFANNDILELQAESGLEGALADGKGRDAYCLIQILNEIHGSESYLKEEIFLDEAKRGLVQANQNRNTDLGDFLIFHQVLSKIVCLQNPLSAGQTREVAKKVRRLISYYAVQEHGGPFDFLGNMQSLKTSLKLSFSRTANPLFKEAAQLIQKQLSFYHNNLSSPSNLFRILEAAFVNNLCTEEFIDELTEAYGKFLYATVELLNQIRPVVEKTPETIIGHITKVIPVRARSLAVLDQLVDIETGISAALGPNLSASCEEIDLAEFIRTQDWQTNQDDFTVKVGLDGKTIGILQENGETIYIVFDFDSDYQGGFLEKIRTNPPLLKRMVERIFSNAAKALRTERKETVIYARLYHPEGNRSQVKLKISNAGQIPAELLEIDEETGIQKIFLLQLNRSNFHHGVGLKFAYEVIQDLDATILATNDKVNNRAELEITFKSTFYEEILLANLARASSPEIIGKLCNPRSYSKHFLKSEQFRKASEDGYCLYLERGDGKKSKEVIKSLNSLDLDIRSFDQERVHQALKIGFLLALENGRGQDASILESILTRQFGLKEDKLLDEEIIGKAQKGREKLTSDLAVIDPFDLLYINIYARRAEASSSNPIRKDKIAELKERLILLTCILDHGGPFDLPKNLTSLNAILQYFYTRSELSAELKEESQKLFKWKWEGLKISSAYTLFEYYVDYLEKQNFITEETLITAIEQFSSWLSAIKERFNETKATLLTEELTSQYPNSKSYFTDLSSLYEFLPRLDFIIEALNPQSYNRTELIDLRQTLLDQEWQTKPGTFRGGPTAKILHTERGPNHVKLDCQKLEQRPQILIDTNLKLLISPIERELSNASIALEENNNLPPEKKNIELDAYETEDKEEIEILISNPGKIPADQLAINPESALPEIFTLNPNRRTRSHGIGGVMAAKIIHDLGGTISIENISDPVNGDENNSRVVVKIRLPKKRNSFLAFSNHLARNNTAAALDTRIRIQDENELRKCVDLLISRGMLSAVRKLLIVNPALILYTHTSCLIHQSFKFAKELEASYPEDISEEQIGRSITNAYSFLLENSQTEKARELENKYRFYPRFYRQAFRDLLKSLNVDQALALLKERKESFPSKLPEKGNFYTALHYCYRELLTVGRFAEANRLMEFPKTALSFKEQRIIQEEAIDFLITHDQIDEANSLLARFEIQEMILDSHHISDSAKKYVLHYARKRDSSTAINNLLYRRLSPEAQKEVCAEAYQLSIEQGNFKLAEEFALAADLTTDEEIKLNQRIVIGILTKKDDLEIARQILKRGYELNGGFLDSPKVKNTLENRLYKSLEEGNSYLFNELFAFAKENDFALSLEPNSQRSARHFNHASIAEALTKGIKAALVEKNPSVIASLVIIANNLKITLNQDLKNEFQKLILEILKNGNGQDADLLRTALANAFGDQVAIEFFKTPEIAQAALLGINICKKQSSFKLTSSSAVLNNKNLINQLILSKIIAIASSQEQQEEVDRKIKIYVCSSQLLNQPGPYSLFIISNTIGNIFSNLAKYYSQQVQDRINQFNKQILVLVSIHSFLLSKNSQIEREHFLAPISIELLEFAVNEYLELLNLILKSYEECSALISELEKEDKNLDKLQEIKENIYSIVSKIQFTIEMLRENWKGFEINPAWELTDLLKRDVDFNYKYDFVITENPQVNDKRLPLRVMRTFDNSLSPASLTPQYIINANPKILRGMIEIAVLTASVSIASSLAKQNQRPNTEQIILYIDLLPLEVGNAICIRVSNSGQLPQKLIKSLTPDSRKPKFLELDSARPDKSKGIFGPTLDLLAENLGGIVHVSNQESSSLNERAFPHVEVEFILPVADSDKNLRQHIPTKIEADKQTIIPEVKRGILQEQDGSYLFQALRLYSFWALNCLNNPDTPWLFHWDIQKGTGFKFARMQVGLYIKNESGQRYYFAFHFFDDQREAQKMHTHVVPLVVLPLHPEGEIGQFVYTMPWEIRDSGVVTSSGVTQALTGVPYAIEDHRGTAHAVQSPGGSHISFVIGHLIDDRELSQQEREPIVDLVVQRQLIARAQSALKKTLEAQLRESLASFKREQKNQPVIAETLDPTEDLYPLEQIRDKLDLYDFLQRFWIALKSRGGKVHPEECYLRSAQLVRALQPKANIISIGTINVLKLPFAKLLENQFQRDPHFDLAIKIINSLSAVNKKGLLETITFLTQILSFCDDNFFLTTDILPHLREDHPEIKNIQEVEQNYLEKIRASIPERHRPLIKQILSGADQHNVVRLIFMDQNSTTHDLIIDLNGESSRQHFPIMAENNEEELLRFGIIIGSAGITSDARTSVVEIDSRQIRGIFRGNQAPSDTSQISQDPLAASVLLNNNTSTNSLADDTSIQTIRNTRKTASLSALRQIFINRHIDNEGGWNVVSEERKREIHKKSSSVLAFFDPQEGVYYLPPVQDILASDVSINTLTERSQERVKRLILPILARHEATHKRQQLEGRLNHRIANEVEAWLEAAKQAKEYGIYLDFSGTILEFHEWQSAQGILKKIAERELDSRGVISSLLFLGNSERAAVSEPNITQIRNWVTNNYLPGDSSEFLEAKIDNVRRQRLEAAATRVSEGLSSLIENRAREMCQIFFRSDPNEIRNIIITFYIEKIACGYELHELPLARIRHYIKRRLGQGKIVSTDRFVSNDDRTQEEILANLHHDRSLGQTSTEYLQLLNKDLLLVVVKKMMEVFYYPEYQEIRKLHLKKGGEWTEFFQILNLIQQQLPYRLIDLIHFLLIEKGLAIADVAQILSIETKNKIEPFLKVTLKEIAAALEFYIVLTFKSPAWEEQVTIDSELSITRENI